MLCVHYLERIPGMSKQFYKVIPHYLTPKHLLTHFAGFVASIQVPWIKNYIIKNFIEKYNVNMSEAVEECFEKYESFNHFFIRKLKADKRPIDPAAIISPVDGVISEAGTIDKGQLLQAKGRYYSVEQLLAEKTYSHRFEKGTFATFYLSPKDYHRIHTPIDARLLEMVYVPGKLFSVQPTTVRAIPYLFARNERLVLIFETAVGLMSMVLVGATIVGAIGTSWHGELKRSKKKQKFSYHDSPVHLKKGEELGYFKLGSTVIMLFEQHAALEWTSIKAPMAIQFGQAIVSSL